MSTVHERLSTFNITADAPTRIKIGKEVAEEYFKQDIKHRPPIYRVETVEADGTFKSWCYPKKFTPVIDTVIRKYFGDVMPKKRKRITVQKVTPKRK